MGGEPATEFRVYRVGVHLLVVVAIFSALFVALGATIAGHHCGEKGDWTFLAAGTIFVRCG